MQMLHIYIKENMSCLRRSFVGATRLIITDMINKSLCNANNGIFQIEKITKYGIYTL